MTTLRIFVFDILKHHHNILRCSLFLISSLAFHAPFQYEIFTIFLIESFTEINTDTVVKINTERSLYTGAVSPNDSILHIEDFCLVSYVTASSCFIILIISLIF